MSGQGPVGALSELIATRRSGECLAQLVNAQSRSDGTGTVRCSRSADPGEAFCSSTSELSAVAWVGCVWARAVQRRDVELAA